MTLTAVERLAELVVSAHNARWALDQGGVESGQGHYPAMVALHSGLLVGAVVEVVVADRPFIPVLGWSALVAVAAGQALRWWCITSLGRRWSTRVIVLPGRPLVERGPYRWLRHPNYLAVALEGLALPLVHGAWVTATAFTVLDAVLLLRFRIPAEERAIAGAAHAPSTGGERR
ncbi:isoprenylcysteine carboxyl methyltransferase family protein [Cellulomonas sp. KRMCY2]|uniref:isoprenylcysteine carboxyl methyltransferase family protein n=1 Tax=Cellulomonas sp. KRMCY2 TaxID=1304865 RepID=UPI0006883AEE|nr:isoprenylcysteine carboxylmethyltransferase family protein [Cellulomonas sp. KRMCY2]